MAKRKDAKTETKTDFLRRVLGKEPALDHREVNLRWKQAGRDGEISSALFYQVRSKMGIKIEWHWVQEEPKATPTPKPSQGQVVKSTMPKAGKATGRLFQLKITLRDVQPPIWRRVLVPDCSFTKLHDIIQVAMGWENYHLYDFEVGGVRYTDPRGMADLDMEDASRAKLSALVPMEKFRFTYTYDFGDDWKHDVLVEKILTPEQAQKYPVCEDGKRACPPEDVGGPWGYEEFIEAIKDPEHERHEELSEWSGEFEPEAFDLDAINKQLRRLR